MNPRDVGAIIAAGDRTYRAALNLRDQATAWQAALVKCGLQPCFTPEQAAQFAGILASVETYLRGFLGSGDAVLDDGDLHLPLGSLYERPALPVAVSPAQDARVTAGEPLTLEWTGDATDYEAHIARGDNPGQPLWSWSGTDTTCTPPQAPAVGVYVWHVRAWQTYPGGYRMYSGWVSTGFAAVEA